MKATTRRTRKPLIHTLETKLGAVKQINMLMAAGVTRYNACRQLAKKHRVTTQTVYNWCLRHDTKITQVNLVNSTTNHIKHNRLTIHSLDVRTTGGTVVKLTPTDIKGIAEYANLV